MKRVAVCVGQSQLCGGQVMENCLPVLNTSVEVGVEFSEPEISVDSGGIETEPRGEACRWASRVSPSSEVVAAFGDAFGPGSLDASSGTRTPPSIPTCVGAISRLFSADGWPCEFGNAGVAGRTSGTYASSDLWARD